jgi:hypothetical protein
MMRRTILPLNRRQFLAQATLAGCAGVTVSTLAEEAAPAAPNALEKQLDSYMQPYVDMKGFSGTVLLSRRGKVVAHRR